jgi:cytochrome c biogenesis protein
MIARLWRFCCSLKVTIVLASAATLTVMGGSLLLPGNPRLFGNIDSLPLGAWLRIFGAGSIGMTWWIPLAGMLMLLLALNTACCFVDWLPRLRTRWRKTGEYLIHLGFVLLLTGYFWGSVAGERHEGIRIEVGQTVAVPDMPGHYLRLEALEPVLVNGRPMDMRGRLVLLRGETELARAATYANHPLLHDDLVAFPASIGRTAEGFRVRVAGQGLVPLTAGNRIDLPDGKTLRVLEFHPQIFRLPNGEFVRAGEELVDPAFRLELTGAGETWQGWFRLAEGVPAPLATAGFLLQPVEPLYRIHGIFTINRDPGAGMAAAGGIAMFVGTLCALFSFYAKRARGDRPDIL